MKYKNILLEEGPNSEAELLVSLRINKEFADEEACAEYVDALEVEIICMLDNDEYTVYTEGVCGNILLVRSDEITFDEFGVDILEEIYNTIMDMELEDVLVEIEVHANQECFKDKNGHEYNKDTVSLEEFLSNIEY